MLGVAIIFLVVAAIFGLVILTAILNDRPTPKPAVYTHGPLAATGLVLVLIYMYYGHRDPLLITSVVLFIIAALGGLTLFTIDMSNKPIPKMLAIAHPILAVIALATLIIYLLS